MLAMAGLAGTLRLGKDVMPVGGADMGTLEKGLGGTGELDAEAKARSMADAFSDAVTVSLGGVGGVGGVVGEALLLGVEVAGECSSLALSAFSLESVGGADSGLASGLAPAETTTGEPRDMALVRKSV